jgi:hypothetical protein
MRMAWFHISRLLQLPNAMHILSDISLEEHDFAANCVRESGPLVFDFIWRGACVSVLHFKRAFAEEQHPYAYNSWSLLFPVNRL